MPRVIPPLWNKGGLPSLPYSHSAYSLGADQGPALHPSAYGGSTFTFSFTALRAAHLLPHSLTPLRW